MIKLELSYSNNNLIIRPGYRLALNYYNEIIGMATRKDIA